MCGICVKIFSMNLYISKCFTTTKNTIDRQHPESSWLFGLSNNSQQKKLIVAIVGTPATICNKKNVWVRLNTHPTLSSSIPSFWYSYMQQCWIIWAIKLALPSKINLHLKEKKEFWISFNANGRRWIFQLTNTSSRWKLLPPTKHCSCRYCSSSLRTCLRSYIARHCITLDTHILFCRSASQSYLPSSQLYGL